jgi:hypothetical protein
VPVNDLVRVAEPPEGYVIIGGGKTAVDACLWLLETGVEPDAICWIKPRDAWFVNRFYAQGGELVGQLFEGIALQLEAAAKASSLTDLFERLSASEQLLRVDEAVTPTKYGGATMSTRELEQLRRIRNVVRLGYVQRIEQDAVVLDQGRIATSPRHLHVHCAARGLNPAPTMPIFSDERIVLQPVRTGLIPFNAALVAFVECSRSDTALKNRLCPPNRLPQVALDWVRGTLIQMQADRLWSKEPDITAWLERARLNPSRGVRQRGDDPRVQRAGERYREHVRAGLEQLVRFAAEAPLE